MERLDRWAGKVKAFGARFWWAAWLLAITLFGFWIFDVGHGPYDAQKAGSAAEWVTGLLTAGGLLFAGLQIRAEERRHRREMDLRQKEQAEATKAQLEAARRCRRRREALRPRGFPTRHRGERSSLAPSVRRAHGC